MINENYLNFLDICKKDGFYADKKCNLFFQVKKGKLYSKGRDGKWDLHYGGVSMPNKKRFLKFSATQARKL